MNYFAPERPRFSNGTPAILDPKDPAGLYQGPLPELVFWIDPAGGYDIEVQLRSSYNSYRIANTAIAEPDIAGMLKQWREDPEQVLKDRFGWEPLEFQASAKAQAQEKSSTSLEDLGL